METAAVQRADASAIADKAEEVAWLVMEMATKEGGLRVIPSARAIGASVKYIRRSKETFQGDPVVEEVIGRIARQRDKPEAMVDVKELDSDLVMSRVDEMVRLLEAEEDRGTRTRAFIYGLAEAMVNASGSGHTGSGERVNEAEARFLADLRAHLGL